MDGGRGLKYVWMDRCSAPQVTCAVGIDHGAPVPGVPTWEGHFVKVDPLELYVELGEAVREIGKLREKIWQLESEIWDLRGQSGRYKCDSSV